MRYDSEAKRVKVVKGLLVKNEIADMVVTSRWWMRVVAVESYLEQVGLN